jgi:hypothetical protein
MADETTNAAPSPAPANEPARVTLRAYAKTHELADWQLAQLCAVTKHNADDELAPDAILDAAVFLDSMTLGG